MKRRVWISWERHRRTAELARAFGARLFVFEPSEWSAVRYPLASLRTLGVLLRERPEVVFVQNPSIVLAGLASFLKTVFGFRLIVDRHTNFRLGKKSSRSPRAVIFNLLSDYSLRRADLTIVTSDYLKALVESKGGRSAVLTDRLPSFHMGEVRPLKGRWNMVCISTFAKDEPYREVVEAVRLLPPDIFVYMTGNHRRAEPAVPEILPPNLVLTGFLEEQDFVDLLFSADGLMDLTTADWCLVCGGYEAMAVGKPFITSDKEILRRYYLKGAVFAENNAEAIAGAILSLLAEKERLAAEICLLRDEKTREWFEQYRAISLLIEDGVAATPLEKGTR